MTRIDTTAESRAWAAARNVPDDVWVHNGEVMSEREFLYGWDSPINSEPLRSGLTDKKGSGSDG